MSQAQRRRTLWIVLLAAAVLLGACQSPSGVAPTPEPADDQAEPFVSVTGRVVPARWAELSFGASARVAEVLVAEGQAVTAGQVLARLDSAELDAAVAQAGAAVQVAEADLARLQAGARPQEVRSAEAARDAVQQAVAGAERGVAVAEAGVAAANAALGSAQAAFAQIKAGPTADEVERARQQVELAKAQRYALQNTRDAVGGRIDKPGYQAGAYEAAEGQVMAAEVSVTIAELNKRILEAGARAEAVAVAAAAVREAQAAVTSALANKAVAEQAVLGQQAALRQAEAQVELVRAGARAEELAVASAVVAQAQAGLQAAEATRARYALVAPFDGMICRLDVRAGEQAAPGVAVLSLGDLTVLRVETTDLDEIDVARVAEGQAVDLTFDALPETHLPGTIQAIALKAGAGSGGTVFKAVIAVGASDPRLRWGMTAFVDVVAE